MRIQSLPGFNRLSAEAERFLALSDDREMGDCWPPGVATSLGRVGTLTALFIINKQTNEQHALRLIVFDGSHASSQSWLYILKESSFFRWWQVLHQVIKISTDLYQNELEKVQFSDLYSVCLTLNVIIFCHICFVLFRSINKLYLRGW